MCLYPLRIRSPAYESLVDAQHRSVFADLSVIPADLYNDVPCGKCWQCRNSARYELVSRLKVEQAVIPHGTRSYFVTLTFNQFSYERFSSDYIIPVRRWLDLLRKRYGRFRYFFLSEIGERFTRRLHFHGIIFGLRDIPYSELCDSYRYGRSWFGYVDNSTCGYITKYMIKQQTSSDFEYRPYRIQSRSLGSGPDDSGIDFVRRNISRSSSDPNSLAKTLTFPGEVSYSYSLGRYYLSKLYTELELLNDRYYRYMSGLRYRFGGHIFPDRDSWISFIAKFRQSVGRDASLKFDAKASLIPLTTPIRSWDRFTTMIQSFTPYSDFYVS